MERHAAERVNKELLDSKQMLMEVIVLNVNKF